MSQVGHVNSKMTMDVYAQLEQRVERSHGIAFDELVRRARGRNTDADRDTSGTPGPSDNENGPQTRPVVTTENLPIPGGKEVARPRLELGTPRFSVVCSTS
jgi:hypothetical protein